MNAREERYLFELPPPVEPEPRVRVPEYPLWTENKAKLIERYLYYFVLVTKHGTYIDGFAGPRDASKPEMWAAKLVLESRPRWLRHFYLFEKNSRKVKQLEVVKESQSPPDPQLKEPKRSIAIYPGDFNGQVLNVLASGSIKQTEATFCLLDQQTFECRWSTLEALARYKKSGHKT